MLYSGLLCEILSLVIYLVDDILELIVVIINVAPYGDHCKYIKYEQIFAILKIAI